MSDATHSAYPTPDLAAEREALTARQSTLYDAQRAIWDAMAALRAADHKLGEQERALQDDSTRLLMREMGVPPAAAVLLKDYDESTYDYHDDIAADPLWGFDYNPNPSFDTGENIEYAYHYDELGWLIRTSERTSRSLAWLNALRVFIARCREAGLNPNLLQHARGATDQDDAEYRAERDRILREAFAEYGATDMAPPGRAEILIVDRAWQEAPGE